MDKEKLLKQANIPENFWDSCYIAENGQIFMPAINKTGEEIYNEWLENKDKKTVKEPTQEEYLLDLDYRLSKIELGV